MWGSTRGAVTPVRAQRLRSLLLALATSASAGAVAEPVRSGQGELGSLQSAALTAEQASGYATGVLVVFVLLGLLVLAFRWSQGRNQQVRTGLKVTACLGLGGKERLMVVQAEGERLLIGVAPGGVSLVRVLDPGEPAGAPRSDDWLSRTLGEKVTP